MANRPPMVGKVPSCLGIVLFSTQRTGDGDLRSNHVDPNGIRCPVAIDRYHSGPRLASSIPPKLSRTSALDAQVLRFVMLCNTTSRPGRLGRTIRGTWDLDIRISSLAILDSTAANNGVASSQRDCVWRNRSRVPVRFLIRCRRYLNPAFRSQRY